MAYYQYYNLDNEDEKRDFWYLMNDSKPEIIEADGIKWKRDWAGIRVQGMVDGKINCWDSRKFVEKTTKPDKIGKLWDRSRELSERRAQESGLGYDPLSKKAKEKWSAERKGRLYPEKKDINIEI